MTYTDEEYELMAMQAIKNYLNKDFTDAEVKQKFVVPMNRIINKAKQLDTNISAGIKSIKEGDQSITYENNTTPFVIDAEIKALLPVPYIKMY